MWKLDYKIGWALKNWYCWIVILEKTLESPWTATSKQSVLKEINPEYSLKGLMLKLKLQYFGHLMQTVNPLEKALMLGKIEGKKIRGWQRMRWLDGITDSMDTSLRNLSCLSSPTLCFSITSHSYLPVLTYLVEQFLFAWEIVLILKAKCMS